MLQIKNIYKEYKTGELIQRALDGVGLSFRKNEFVSILGPSGSGKTTLLNIIGGLDSYDSGDLIINGTSTKGYKDRDWDTYRNYTIGFVFQSYNLIPHQTVLGNVELALTIGGISKQERRKRAKDALINVGLKEHTHKKPNQLSGGQMQRVAIARALVNNPDILLADEPTGALDTETSIQIMELLKEVAKERLVVMVTHNPELAEEYSSRIVKLKDGRIVGDTDPFIIDETVENTSKLDGAKKAKMSVLTSFSLSFQNLMTKKRRTLLTSFAGSIGIIGIALIMSLSSGVNSYIDTLQSETMESYPITIEAEAMDYAALMGGSGMPTSGGNASNNEKTDAKEGVYSDYSEINREASLSIENNLTDFKAYLEGTDSQFNQYLGESGIVYSYDTNFDVFTYDSEGNLVNTDADPEALTTVDVTQSASSVTMESGGGGGPEAAMSQMVGNTTTDSAPANFTELMAGNDEGLVNETIIEGYDMLSGGWPENYNEVVLFVDENNEVSAGTLYQLGLITADEYIEVSESIEDEEEVAQLVWDYEEILGQELFLVTAADRFEETDSGLFTYNDDTYYEENKSNVTENTKLKIVGVAKPNAEEDVELVSSAIGYTTELTDSIISETNESSVVVAQESDKTKSVLTGETFDSEDSSIPTYDEIMVAFGKVNYDAPTAISIYTDSFEDKDAAVLAIDDYNSTVDEENQIVYTDLVETMTSSMTQMIDVITYVLIAFVAVSLIVSCIMIGIITHISVLERTKEIGVLRALGASKANISQVFNAETVIIGLCSGLLGVVITMILNIPITAIIQNLVGSETLTTALPIETGAILIAISVIITALGGLLPAKSAAKKDPVIALRTE